MMISDLRFAGRKLTRSPGFTFVAVLTLAIGIGANTAMFSIVRNVLLRPLPFAEPERLVALGCIYPNVPEPIVADQAEYEDWKAQHDLFAATTGYERTSQSLLLPDAPPRSLPGLEVTPSYLATLGVKPVLGRDFADGDALAGAAPVVLLSHTLWQTQFGGDPAIIGKLIRLGSAPLTVIGVLPPDYRGTLPTERTPEFLQPLQIDPSHPFRGRHSIQVVARLQPGITLAQATRRLAEISDQLKHDRNIQHGVALQSLHEFAIETLRGRVITLSAAMGLILLIACVNIANLMLVRVTGRTAEISVKMALGASRTRITREILAESALIGGAAVMLGSLLAALTLDLAGNLLRGQFASFSPIALDGAVLAFSIGLTLLTVVLFGLFPAWRATSAWERFMRSIGRSATTSPEQRRMNAVFVSAQIALTMLLLVGAGLLLRSMQRILTQENGFVTRNVIVAGVNPSFTRYADRATRRQFFERLLTRLRAAPGIETATITDSVPPASTSYGPMYIRGVTWPKDDAPTVDKTSVGPGFFASLGMTLVAGREFLPTDVADAPGVVVVNESFARKFFPGEDPIGREVTFDSRPTDPQWQRIVGVVRDARLAALDREPAPAMFACYLQSWAAFMQVIVHSPLDQTAVAKIIRTEVAAIDPEVPLTRISTLQQIVDNSLAQRVLITWTIGAAAALSLGLALLGLYSVIAYTVAQQTREIGIRVALGADAAEIKRWVTRRGLALVASGLGIGAVASLLGSQLLGSLVYGVSTRDPLTYLGVTAALGAMALLAAWLPARRAAKVDPMVALRAE